MFCAPVAAIRAGGLKIPVFKQAVQTGTSIGATREAEAIHSVLWRLRPLKGDRLSIVIGLFDAMAAGETTETADLPDFLISASNSLACSCALLSD